MNIIKPALFSTALILFVASGTTQAHSIHGSHNHGHHNNHHIIKAPENAKINKRQSNQSQRIENGRRDGSLTHSEYHRLKTQQNHIHQQETRFKQDGHLSRHDIQHLTHALDRASNDIRKARHNRDYGHSHHQHGFHFHSHFNHLQPVSGHKH